MLQIFMCLKESFPLILSWKKMQETYQDKHNKVATDMDKVNQVLQYKES